MSGEGQWLVREIPTGQVPGERSETPVGAFCVGTILHANSVGVRLPMVCNACVQVKMAFPDLFRGETHWRLLAQQSQYALWQLIGLSHHCRPSLLKNLGARQVGCFHGVVGIHDATA